MGRTSRISRDVLLSVETLEEVRRLIAEAIEFHIEGLQKAGYDVPQPSFTPPVHDQPGMSSELISAQG